MTIKEKLIEWGHEAMKNAIQCHAGSANIANLTTCAVIHVLNILPPTISYQKG